MPIHDWTRVEAATFHDFHCGWTIHLKDARQPVLSIAGEGDGIAPLPAVHAVARFLPDARLESAPGGHLGVLTGRKARTTTWRVLHDWLEEHDPQAERAKRLQAA